jgi:hypothetical protein
MLAVGVAFQALAFSTNVIWFWPVGVFLAVIALIHNPEFRLLPRYALLALFSAVVVAVNVLQVPWLWLTPILILSAALAWGFFTGRFSTTDAAIFLKFAAPGIVLPIGMFPLFLLMAAGYVGLACLLIIPLFAGSFVWAWRLKKEHDRLRASA